MSAIEDPAADDKPRKVEVDEPAKLSFWSAHFKVKAEELLACVAEVGNEVDDIEKRLRQAGKLSFRFGGED